MTLHSDSIAGATSGALAFLAAAWFAIASLAHVSWGEYRKAWSGLLAAAGIAAVYLFVVSAVSLISPQRIVAPGDGYCYDNWCIAVENVRATPAGRNVHYTVGVRIFSDADRVQTSAKGASVFLMDERGHRFSLVDDRAAIPFDVELSPGQSVRTSLNFLAAADARELFLTGDTGKWNFFPSLYLGGDSSIFHKRTLLRVA